MSGPNQNFDAYRMAMMAQQQQAQQEAFFVQLAAQLYSGLCQADFNKAMMEYEKEKSNYTASYAEDNGAPQPQLHLNGNLGGIALFYAQNFMRAIHEAQNAPKEQPQQQSSIIQ